MTFVRKGACVIPKGLVETIVEVVAGVVLRFACVYRTIWVNTKKLAKCVSNHQKIREAQQNN